MKIKIAPTARQQIAELVQWWNTHRRAARVRVEDAVTTALDAMLSNPEIGSRYSKEPRYRLWRLKGTPYVLFYPRIRSGLPWCGAPSAERARSCPEDGAGRGQRAQAVGSSEKGQTPPTELQ